ncbi:MAG: radical SAM/SPASM domain-containing protein [Candidatus Pacearchaeota archaeon]|jgi:radical SAM protein with 4Fe4S-binding SPASM domain
MIKTYLKLRNQAKESLFFLKKNALKKTIFPEIINIETSVLCNANCITCPHKEIVRKINMDFSLFKKILDEIHNYNVKEIHPFNYGEPFLYKEFINALKYIRQKSPNSKIFIYSNGAAMTNEQMQEVVTQNLLDKVNFSLDAANSDTYKTVRGLDYDKTIEKINHFLELNKQNNNKIEVSVSFVITEQNKKQISEFKKIWKNKANIHLGVDDGREGKPFINKSSNKPCSWPFNRITILTNGEVVICCIDAMGKLILGNVEKNTIKEIWDSPQYENIRQLHLSKKKDQIPLCANCFVRY